MLKTSNKVRSVLDLMCVDYKSLETVPLRFRYTKLPKLKVVQLTKTEVWLEYFRDLIFSRKSPGTDLGQFILIFIIHNA
jgi:hypothetical protein